MTENAALTTYEFTLESAIVEWLAAKRRRSGSERTVAAYRDTLTGFRAALGTIGLDLLSSPVDVARAAALWASGRKQSARPDRAAQPVAASTYNQRLAVISSFYSFLNATYHLAVENPVAGVEKRKVQAYATARYIEDIDEVLAGIDRRTRGGRRDYAILAVALATGRRASELVGLRAGDIEIGRARRGQPELLTLTFHTKGGKLQRDRLDAEVSGLLLDYLHAEHGPDLLRLPLEAPVWVSYSRRNAGQPIGYKALYAICDERLGRKPHDLRHTFTHGMIEANAPITTIGERLGHSDIKTTLKYGRELVGADNPFAPALTARFGIKRRT